MEIKKRSLLYFFVLITVATNLLLIKHINVLFISTILSFFTFLIMPGFLVVLSLKIKKLYFWEYLFLIIGISISFLEFGGLLTNQLLPHMGNSKPLSLQPLLATFDLYLLILFLFTAKRLKRVVTVFKIPKFSFSRKKLILYAVPTSFPILAAIGAISINNNGTNLVTISLLGLIGLFTMWIIYLRKRLPDNIFPYSIFFISLALLFTSSLRGWFITGHDIQREYYVFMLAKNHSLWDIAFYRDAYNACLSITILPTVLTHFLSIQDIYIYKFVYQILFSICPVIIFYILRKYTTRIFAFLSVFYFMSFPTFFNDMPYLTRQEIGFIFFGIMLYVTILTNIPVKTRKILFMLCGVSIIVSHYSTNYVVLALLSGMLVLSFISKWTRINNLFLSLISKFRISTKSKFKNKPFVSFKMLFVLILITFLWNSKFTMTSNTITNVTSRVLQSILIKSPSESKSIDVSYSLFFSHKQTLEDQLKGYINENIAAADKRDEGPFYSKSIYDKFPIRSLSPAVLPLTPIGNALVFLHFPVSSFQTIIRQLSATFMQVFIFLGFLLVLLHKKRSDFDLQYVFISITGISLLLLMILIPQISVEYGLLRLFLQLLFLLSLPVVLATDTILKFVREDKRIYLVGFIAVAFFLNLTGFISHTTGGYAPQLTLDNAGLYYDAFYVKQTDVSSIEWLKENKILISAPVQTDNSGLSKLLIYGDTQGLKEIFPAIIRRNAYVFLTDASIKNAIVSFEANTLIFTSPIDFLSKNKNLIYNNGSNRIYK